MCLVVVIRAPRNRTFNAHAEHRRSGLATECVAIDGEVIPLDSVKAQHLQVLRNASVDGHGAALVVPPSELAGTSDDPGARHTRGGREGRGSRSGGSGADLPAAARAGLKKWHPINAAHDDFALDVVDRLITCGVRLAIDHEKAGRSLSGESSHLEVPREV
eukprot:CAMPEP_0177401370 /NCGR_PEP_ID=MMETSP0368-20130122/59610_1 /TAXON_ID=447022 ORGANISM="Scrippsiella hangoei-like, Strain SHHI-4" /NCGR_SAMPLE_ID=MMETSP0368 /ASSEMBLY_ACC=CAM_ASM_000363 /LENGTH=160 /DNA_ID=CAMNT_0018868939 /DNA_START=33 /DNA_END=512 /DNA_ORIENTATION=-